MDREQSYVRRRAKAKFVRIPTRGDLQFAANSPWTARCRHLIEMHLEDLGGEQNCSANEQAIVRRAAVIITELEILENQFALAERTNPQLLDLYVRVASGLRRLLETIGLERRPRDVTNGGGVFPGGLPRWLPPSELRNKIRNEVEDVVEERGG
jgi:hypothetical protein